jgi:hypothetical protein
MMSGYNNYWKMGWFMTNSSTSKLQRLILKRVKALLRKVMTNLLPISTPDPHILIHEMDQLRNAAHVSPP